LRVPLPTILDKMVCIILAADLSKTALSRCLETTLLDLRLDDLFDTRFVVERLFFLLLLLVAARLAALLIFELTGIIYYI
tara:strand:- start:185 stop:424 length:240 start_codon:yes stop_codon:yes gene_type:complete